MQFYIDSICKGVLFQVIAPQNEHKQAYIRILSFLLSEAH